MYDATPMYPEGFHAIDTHRAPSWERKAVHYTRTDRPVRYIIIDFGLSVHITEDYTRLVYPAHGRDRTAPEHRPELLATQTPHDPFPTDVYYLGNFILKEFIEVGRAPSFHLRPSLKQVLGLFGRIRVHARAGH